VKNGVAQCNVYEECGISYAKMAELNKLPFGMMGINVGINTNYTRLGVVVGYDTCFLSSVLLMYGTRCHPLLISSL